jgi:methyl-accepting chemotaxis protein
MNARTVRYHSEAGIVGIFAPLLVVAVVAVGGAVYGLNRTASLATDIDRQTASIATGAGGINTSTKAILKLDETNALGDSIEETAQPLEEKLTEVIRLAGSIDQLASSINGTAGAINSSANGINGHAGAIQNTARSINNGVARINENVDTTIDLVRQIKADTANIIGQAATARRLSACIDAGLRYGGISHQGQEDGHCQR